MARRMSFALTEGALLAGTKDVTRRLGWQRVREGEQLVAVRKCMGLKRGESQVVLAVIEVLRVSRERLDTISPADVVREGFPFISTRHFLELFCAANKCEPTAIVTRIEFRVLLTFAGDGRPTTFEITLPDGTVDAVTIHD